MNALEIRNVTKRFGKVVANKDINLTVEKGEILAVLGENGSGKTTLMKCILSLIRYDSGSVTLDGAAITPPAPLHTDLLPAATEKLPALLPADACVINVGRGTALDQKALAEALNSGKLAGAALDVMDPEPLPQDDPLWDARNIILTPHVSGNMTLGYTCDENVARFCADLENYAAGRPLAGLVDRNRGY